MQKQINLPAGKPIALIGMMGTGKTTLGQLLAQELGLDFIDTDAVIEAAQGRSISQIFARDGESEFRKVESETILNILSAQPRAVIATGGGAVTTPATLHALLDQTHLCWLQLAPAAIYAYIKQDPARPLLQTPDPLGRLESLLAERSPLYSQAPHHMQVNDENPLETLAELVALFADKR